MYVILGVWLVHCDGQSGASLHTIGQEVGEIVMTVLLVTSQNHKAVVFMFRRCFYACSCFQKYFEDTFLWIWREDVFMNFEITWHLYGSLPRRLPLRFNLVIIHEVLRNGVVFDHNYRDLFDWTPKERIRSCMLKAAFELIFRRLSLGQLNFDLII